MMCSISNCEEIMCRTYVFSIGYVCKDCQKRFKSWLLTLNEPLYLDSNQFIKQKLEEFKQINISHQDNMDLSQVDDFFEEHTDY